MTLRKLLAGLALIAALIIGVSSFFMLGHNDNPLIYRTARPSEPTGPTGPTDSPACESSIARYERLGLGAKDYLVTGARGDIDKFYDISEDECYQFHPCDQECIRKQFDANWHWYVLRDQNLYIGPPGVPGPSLEHDEATTDPNKAGAK